MLYTPTGNAVTRENEIVLSITVTSLVILTSLSTEIVTLIFVLFTKPVVLATITPPSTNVVTLPTIILVSILFKDKVAVELDASAVSVPSNSAVILFKPLVQLMVL